MKKTIALSSTFILLASTTLAQTSKDEVLQLLANDGYQKIKVQKTIFGNTKFKALGPNGEREIVLGKGGQILKDRVKTDDEGGDDRSSNRRGYEDEADDHDSDENDDRDDDEGNDRDDDENDDRDDDETDDRDDDEADDRDDDDENDDED